MKKNLLVIEIIQFIKEKLEESGVEIKHIEEVSIDTPLIGKNGVIDSMGVVELCLLLEDKALDEDFEFDWASDSAMSNSRSMFKSVGSIAENFLDQSKKK